MVLGIDPNTNFVYSLKRSHKEISFCMFPFVESQRRNQLFDFIFGDF